MNTMKLLRRTGRTTRMLRDVLATIETRKAFDSPITPVVIFSDQSQIETFKLQPEYNKIFMIGFKQAVAQGYIDPNTLETKPRGPEYIWIDHSVIEMCFARIIETLHRFDSDE